MSAPRTTICGIDPGLSGAIALIADDDAVAVFDMPVLELKRGGKTKRDVDAHSLAQVLQVAAAEDGDRHFGGERPHCLAH